MKNALVRFRTCTALLFVAALGFPTMPTWAHGNIAFGTPNVIHACRSVLTLLRQIDSGNCQPGEQIVHWNITGPKGDKGDQGVAGPAGSGGSGASCPNGNTATTGGHYIDCADGTLVDANTGLMWEKKTNTCPTADLTDPHCVLNLYSWTNTSIAVYPTFLPDGTLYGEFLERLNDLKTPNDGTATPCFAGHCDWRIPTIAELRSILLAPYPICTQNPCIDPAFGPTPASSAYWSSSEQAADPAQSWVVGFANGVVGGSFKGTTYNGRAVRGGR